MNTLRRQKAMSYRQPYEHLIFGPVGLPETTRHQTSSVGKRTPATQLQPRHVVRSHLLPSGGLDQTISRSQQTHTQMVSVFVCVVIMQLLKHVTSSSFRRGNHDKLITCWHLSDCLHLNAAKPGQSDFAKSTREAYRGA